MIRTVIIDDEQGSRNTLTSLLNMYCSNISVVGEAGSIAEGMKTIQLTAPELLFLDVSMPDGDGFDLLDKLNKQNVEVIFVTAYYEYAIRAIKASAIDYLLKPIDIEELLSAVHKAEEQLLTKRRAHDVQSVIKQMQQKHNRIENIAVPVNNGLQFIPLKNIIRMTASGSYTHIFCTNDAIIISSKPLKEYEGVLPAEYFFRIHHSHIINLTYIKHYHKGNGGYVTMNDGSVVDVSKRRKKDFLDIFET